MSKLFKGVKKGIKKVFGAIKKIYKKITSTTIGKILLAAAAIYVGGVALGKWGAQGPLKFLAPAGNAPVAAGSSAVGGVQTAAIPGATVGSGGASLTGTNVAIGATGEVGAVGTITGEVIGGTTGAVAGAGAEAGAVAGALGSSVPEIASVGGSLQAAAPLVTTGTQTAAGLNLGAAGTTTVGGNVLGQSLFGNILAGASKGLSWAAANPVPAAMIAGGVSSAFKKDPMEDQRKYEKELLGQAYDNDALRKISIFGKTADDQGIGRNFMQMYGGTAT